MGLVFNNFTIKGIDVSQYNGTIEWDKVKEKDCDFSAIRVGYGRVTDAEFNSNWTRAKGLTFRVPYWYMDYYSNHSTNSIVNGMSDVAWGKEQANYCWEQVKAEQDSVGIVFLDIESGAPSYSPPITEVTSRAQTIARAFLEEFDRLSGRFNGIYCSLGLLNWFGAWFKNRPLWIAWYSETMMYSGVYINRTPESVTFNAKLCGWTGDILIWQYASDGDATNDGIADGVSFGMDYKFLDLNGWIETAEKWEGFCNGYVLPEPPEEPPVIIPPIVEEFVVLTDTLNIRDVPIGVAGSQVVGKYYKGAKVTPIEVVTIGNDIWARVTTWTVCAIKYGNVTYME